MLLLFLLGGLQGFIGWWMVASGLRCASRSASTGWPFIWAPRLLLLVAILWIALEYLRAPAPIGAKETELKSTGMSKRATAFAVLVYFQMLLGALVAGLHAGLIYNTWPDMNGRVLPEDPFFSRPWWINFFENPGLAQFDHRIGAYIVAAFAALDLCSRHQAVRLCQDQRQAGGDHHRLPDRAGHRHAVAAGAGMAGRGAPGHGGLPFVRRRLACV